MPDHASIELYDELLVTSRLFTDEPLAHGPDPEPEQNRKPDQRETKHLSQKLYRSSERRIP